MRVRISSEVLAAIRVHAAAEPGLEVCGLLFGAEDRIDGVMAAPNVAEDPARRFEIEAATLLAAIRSERAGGAKLMGYYHSHPSGDAQASPRDQAQAPADGRIWLILGQGEFRAFRATERGLLPIALSSDCNANGTALS